MIDPVVLVLLALVALKVFELIRPGDFLRIPGSVAGPRSPYDGLFYRYSIAHGVPARLMFAIVAVESDFNPRALNTESAADKRLGRNVDSIGLCQILYPDTAEALQPGISREELYNPEINLNLGFRLMASLLRSYRDTDPAGFPASAVAAYNAGQPRRTSSGDFTNQAYVDDVHEEWRAHP